MTSMFSKSSQNSSRDSSDPEVPLRRWEEEQDDDYCNPDKLLLCPYDSNHKIRACRFPYHLIKCKKNNPEVARELRTCPFNARHLMPQHELSRHMSTCVDRCSINTDYAVTDESQRKFQVPVSTWTIPVCDEDWDQEEEKSGSPATTFVWGVSTSQLNQDQGDPAMIYSLTSSVRAPRVLPWK